MSRSEYAVKHSYTGAGNKNDYTFDFKIEEKKQLLVIESDENGDELNRVRGTDTSTFIDSVTFDSEDGGGTVNLLSNLDSNHGLLILLANDEPTQPTEWRNKGSFTLRGLENALDWLGGAIQRLTYRANRAVTVHDLDDLSSFDPMLPQDIVGTGNSTIVTNAAGDGWKIGPTIEDIEEAESYAEDAEAAKDDAEAAQAAAEAAQQAAEDAADTVEAFANWQEYSVTNGQSMANLSNAEGSPQVDFDDYSSKVWECEIIRGSTVVANGQVAIQNVNGTGRAVAGGFITEEFHGVTFDVGQTGSVCVLQAALDSGAGNGTIKLSERIFPPS